MLQLSAFHGFLPCKKHELPLVSKMPQLSTEQRVFVVTEYARTQNSTIVQDAFRARFPDRDPPPRSTILRNVAKYQERNGGNVEGQGM